MSPEDLTLIRSHVSNVYQGRQVYNRPDCVEFEASRTNLATQVDTLGKWFNVRVTVDRFGKEWVEVRP